MICEDCTGRMLLESGLTRRGIDIRWRCGDRDSRKTTSIFNDSVFDGIKIHIDKTLKILYFHALDQPVVEISNQSSVDENSISSILKNIHPTYKDTTIQQNVSKAW